MVLTLVDGSPPPINNPRVELPHPPISPLVDVKSPKSTAFPVCAIVMYSIVLRYVAVGATYPPIIIPLVELEHPDPLDLQLEVERSPKFAPFPVEEIVTNSMSENGPGAPPKKKPLVLEDKEPCKNLAVAKLPKLVEFPVESTLI